MVWDALSTTCASRSIDLAKNTSSIHQRVSSSLQESLKAVPLPCGLYIVLQENLCHRLFCLLLGELRHVLPSLESFSIELPNPCIMQRAQCWAGWLVSFCSACFTVVDMDLCLLKMSCSTFICTEVWHLPSLSPGMSEIQHLHLAAQLCLLYCSSGFTITGYIRHHRCGALLRIID